MIRVIQMISYKELTDLELESMEKHVYTDDLVEYWYELEYVE